MGNNQLIVESQETGKTTYLFNEFNRLFSEGLSIIVLDSATEHENKSLLKQIINKYEESVVIDMRDEKKIVLDELSINEFIANFMNYFPFSDIIKNKGKIICFDLSYFLEKGYEVYENINDVEQYNYYRKLYNNLSQQIVLSLILIEKYGLIKEKIVIMDEIELPIVDYDISIIQNNLSFLASVHPENAFGTFYKNFEKIRFKPYQKRKDC